MLLGLVAVEHGHGPLAQVPVGHQAVILLESPHRLRGELAIDPIRLHDQIPQLQQPLLPDEDLVGLVPDPNGVGHGLLPEKGL